MLWIYIKTFLSRYKIVLVFAFLAFLVLIAGITYFLNFKISETKNQLVYAAVTNLSKIVSSDLSAYIVQSQTIAEYLSNSELWKTNAINVPTRNAIDRLYEITKPVTGTVDVTSASNILFISLENEDINIKYLFEDVVMPAAFYSTFKSKIKAQKKFYDQTEWFIMDPFQIGVTDEYYIPICIKDVSYAVSNKEIKKGTMCILYPWTDVWKSIKEECEANNLNISIMGYDATIVYDLDNSWLIRDPEAVHATINLPYKEWTIAAKLKESVIFSFTEILKEGYFIYLLVLFGMLLACVVIFIQYKSNYDLSIRTEMILDNIHDTAWSMTVDGFKLTWISAAIKHLNGRSPHEMANNTIFDIVVDETAEEFCNVVNQQIVTNTLAGNTSNVNFTIEGLAKHIHGYNVWVEISGIIAYRNGKYSEIHGISRRIDERKETQTLMMKQHQDLSEANRTKNMLFSIIAHDLKNPFAALLNIAEVLASHFDKMNRESLSKSVGIILNSANHIYTLLENLLMWSRSQVDSIIYNPTKSNLWFLINKTIGLIEAQAVNKNVRLKLLAPQPLDEEDLEYSVFADEDMIFTVLRNIITNAVKFSQEKSEVLVNIQKYPEDHHYLLVSIKDSGVGMTPQTMDKLFQISSISSTKGTKNETGTGLGLIVVKDFIDKHNSKIWVTSEVNKGTTFYFTLLSWREHHEHVMPN